MRNLYLCSKCGCLYYKTGIVAKKLLEELKNNCIQLNATIMRKKGKRQNIEEYRKNKEELFDQLTSYYINKEFGFDIRRWNASNEDNENNEQTKEKYTSSYYEASIHDLITAQFDINELLKEAIIKTEYEETKDSLHARKLVNIMERDFIYRSENEEISYDCILNINKELIQEINLKFSDTDNCPLCTNEGNLVWYIKTISEISEYKIDDMLEEYDKNNSNEIFNEFFEINKDKKSSKTYQTDNIKIKELLLNLINTEKNINFLEKILKNMIQQKLLQDRNKLKNEYMFKECIGNDVLLEIKKSIQEPEIPKKVVEPQKPNLIAPSEPKYIRVHLLNRKFAIEENTKLKNKYEDELKKYNTAFNDYENARTEYINNIDKYEEKLKKYNIEKQKYILKCQTECKKLTNSKFREIIEKINLSNDDHNLENFDDKHKEYLRNYINSKLCLDFYDENIEELKKILIDLYKCKNDLISLNIIYSKYNDLVAWTTMYEYFISERVSSLTGKDGAYNMYENEIRSNIIISQLDIIISQLKDIKKNQYMLYEIMTNINNNISQLNNCMYTVVEEIDESNKILTDIKKISSFDAYSNLKKAYYSKIIAEKIDALGFLVALK